MTRRERTLLWIYALAWICAGLLVGWTVHL